MIISLPLFQSTRPSQTSTIQQSFASPRIIISIHEAFADLDPDPPTTLLAPGDFNPRGLRRPRPVRRLSGVRAPGISIHEAFADLDAPDHVLTNRVHYFNPRGLRRPRPVLVTLVVQIDDISIHEAFADLDYSAQNTHL